MFLKHPRSGLPPTVLYNLSYLQLQLQLNVSNQRKNTQSILQNTT